MRVVDRHLGPQQWKLIDNKQDDADADKRSSRSRDSNVFIWNN